MADEKITQLATATSLVDADLFVVVTGVGSTPATKGIASSNVSVEKLRESGGTTLTVGAVSDGQYFTRSGSTIIGATLTAGLPSGHLYRLTLSNNGTDANNDIDIAAGECRDGTDAVDIEIASAITKRLDAAWAVGTNQGGLDTGTKANSTWYHLWAIKRSDTGVTDVLFSTSATAPTMPTNYDYKRRLGAVKTDGSGNILPFTQYKRMFLWKTPVQDVSATNPGTSAVSRTLSTPLGVKTVAMVSSAVSPTAAATLVYLSSLDQTDVAASNSAFTFGTFSTSIGAYGGYQQIRTDTSSQIRSRLNTSGASTNLFVVTHGYLDDEE